MASYPTERHALETDLEAAQRARPRSCSGVSSDRSSTSSQGRYRPMSSSSGPSSTLVQPRPWRFLHKARLGSSLEREKAMEEDTSLEGDHDNSGTDGRSEEDFGSSVDGDMVVLRRRREEEEEGKRDGEKVSDDGGPEGSSVDGVVRTKSESDIAVKRKLMGNGDAPRKEVVFKSRAQRFSSKGDKASSSHRPPSTSTSTSLSRSHTLPLSLPPKLLAAAAGSSGLAADKSFTLPPSTAPIASLPEVNSSTDQLVADAPRPVEGASGTKPEPEARRQERRRSVDDRKVVAGSALEVSPIAQTRPSSLWASPGSSSSSSTRDALTTPRASEPVHMTSTPKSPDKPKVPAKPARRSSLKSGSPARDSPGSVSSTASPTRAGPPKPPRTTLDPNRRSSSSPGTPKSPEESILFSMGFTVVADEKKKTTAPPQQDEHNGLQDWRPKPKTDTRDYPQRKEEAVDKNRNITTHPDVHRELVKADMYSSQDIEDVFAEAGSDRGSSRPSQSGSEADLKMDNVQLKEQEIKKMTKIKGDKKAEEKASKAKKKEQKAKEKEAKAKEKEAKAKEKEAKAKMKAVGKDEKKGVKLFPWKAESSAKDKGSAAAAAGGDVVDGGPRANGGDGSKGIERVSAPILLKVSPPSSSSSSLSAAVPGANGVHHTTGAGPRKTGDGRDGAAGNKSPSDRSASDTSSSQEPSPSTPPSSPPYGEKAQDVPPAPQQTEEPQGQQQTSPRSPPKTPHKQTTPASSPSKVPKEGHPSPSKIPSSPTRVAKTASSPVHQHQQQQQQQQRSPQHQQQPSPLLQRHRASPSPAAAVSAPSSPQHHLQQQQQSPQLHREGRSPKASPRHYQERLVGEPVEGGRDEGGGGGVGVGEGVPSASSSRSPSGSPAHHATPPDDLSSSDPNSSDLDSVSGGGVSTLRSRRSRQGSRGGNGSQSVRCVRVSESDGEATSPDGEVPGRRLQGAPRRHTVGGAQIREQMGAKKEMDSDRKREAFYELLATRYPQYADKITMATHHQLTTAAERNPRPREPQRRRTTVATYNPQSSHLLDHEDAGTMSDVEPSSFQRGGLIRASLPIVRSASSSLERPIGLVFLVYGAETKKALLPNEITSLDTVRALFVRAFPDRLSMEFLDSPKRKIYILEAATSIFCQLEDLREIVDRAVLKIHECDSEEPQRVKSQPPESRGRVQQVAVPSRPSSRQGYASDTGIHYDMVKGSSLPLSNQNYHELMQRERAHWEMEQEYMQRRSRSRSQTPELAERPRSLSTGAPRNRYSHSPERMAGNVERGAPPPPQPHSLGPIPENPRLLANGFRQAALSHNGGHYEVLPGRGGGSQHPHPHPHPHHHPGAPPGGGGGRVLSPPTVGQQPIYESVYQPVSGGPGGVYHHPHPHPHPQAYVSHSMRTVPPQGPQRATGPPPHDMRGGSRNEAASRHAMAYAAMSNPIYESFPPQRTQSYRAAPERDVVPVPRPHSAQPHDSNRMERMEAQIANLAAWVHHVHAPPTDVAHRRGPGSSRSTSTSSHSEGTDTYPGSSASKENGEGSVSASPSPGLSDIPGTYSVARQSTPAVSGEVRAKMHDMACRLRELRVELQGLKRMEQLHQDTMRGAFTDTITKIKEVMGPGKGDNIYGELLQLSSNSPAHAYLRDKARVEHDLRGLESQVEGVRKGVEGRTIGVSVGDIEGQAMQLSHIARSIADLKARCPQIYETLQCRRTGEVQDISKEQFLREEPAYIESALKRCKNLTTNLVTLKRLAAPQDSSKREPPVVSSTEVKADDEVEDTMAILENIRAMVPDFDARIQSLEAAAESQKSKPVAPPPPQPLPAPVSATANCRPTHTPHTANAPNTPYTTPTDSSVDGQRSEPPQVPAKPARLLSASEIKQHLGSVGGSVLAPVSMAPHTVTVTSQMAQQPGDSAVYADRQSVDNAVYSADRQSARTAFFSSMQSPPSSPAIASESGKTSSSSPASNNNNNNSSRLPTTMTVSKAGGGGGGLSPMVSSSSSLISPSHSAGYYQAVSPTRSRSAFSSIPLPNRADKDDSSKGKKVPPPPPPRTSSAKLYCSPLSPNGGGGLAGRRNSGERSPGPSKKDTALSVFNPTASPTSPGVAGGHRASSKFQKDLAAGIYANLNRPDLQQQNMHPDRLITTMAPAPAPPAPAAVVTNSQDPQEGELSGSESTGSSTSLDSQQGASLLRSNSSASGRGPKPCPPQRHSSLHASREESGSSRSKTQMLQERARKSQDGGSSRRASSGSLGQVNGMDAARNGHQT